MGSDAQRALRRLRRALGPNAARRWLEGARVDLPRSGGYTLRVRGPFEKQWIENHFAGALQRAFGGPVSVEAEGERTPEPGSFAAAPFLVDPANALAARLVRRFGEGGAAVSPLLVLHGPRGSGKSSLLEL
ncbi:MAG: hypothetical protein ACE5JG_04195, partial [Planctomycetota bacterium]